MRSQPQQEHFSGEALTVRFWMQTAYETAHWVKLDPRPTEGEVMAALRKSARAGQARKKALDQAAEFETRHQNLVKLAEKYFEAEGGIEDIEEELEEQIEALRVAAATRISGLKESLKVTAQAMLDTKEPKANVAQRLGLSGSALGKLVGGKEQAPTVTDSQQASADAHSE